MQFFGWTLADRHAGDELAQHGADRQTGNGADLRQLSALRIGQPDGDHVFFVRSLTLLSAVFAAKLPARRRHWGLGRAPASAFVIQTLCLRQRRHGGVGFRPAARGFVCKRYGNCNIGRALPASS